MNKTELLQRAQRRLEGLCEQHLVVADHFLAWLEECEGEEATAELLRIPGFVEELEEAERDIAEGRTVSVEELRRKY